VWELAKD